MRIDLRRHMFYAVLMAGSLLGGCAAPQYAVRQTPRPNESASIVQLESALSRMQAAELAKEGIRPIGPHERLWGFEVDSILLKLAAATERPHLPWQAYLLQNDDPNAAALADGRVFVTTGLLQFLSKRPNGEAELTFVLGHELAHTVAQHLVRRYEKLQQQSALMALVAMGTSRLAAGGAQGAALLTSQVANVLNDVSLNGYSQDQELEADQLGLRYMQALHMGPEGALSLLEAFRQFDAGVPMLRSHPYASLRYDYLQRYLQESQAPPTVSSIAPSYMQPKVPENTRESAESRVRFLRSVQATYPKDSVSWKNLEKQIQELER